VVISVWRSYQQFMPQNYEETAKTLETVSISRIYAVLTNKNEYEKGRWYRLGCFVYDNWLYGPETLLQDR
jgi:hypothetical protein